MKKILVVLLLCMQQNYAQKQITQYYLIRHAEKVDNSENPNLSSLGQLRSEKWVKIFSDISLDAIYNTNYYRTIQTATPISKAKNLSIQIYDSKNIDLKTFLKNTKNKSTLIVVHSNSTPEFVNKLIRKSKYEKIAETTFGNLYLVTVYLKNKSTSLVLKLE